MKANKFKVPRLEDTFTYEWEKHNLRPDHRNHDIDVWFDIDDIEHLKAYQHLTRHGEWPEDFPPEHIQFPTGWDGRLRSRLADAYVDFELGKDTRKSTRGLETIVFIDCCDVPDEIRDYLFDEHDYGCHYDHIVIQLHNDGNIFAEWLKGQGYKFSNPDPEDWDFVALYGT